MYSQTHLNRRHNLYLFPYTGLPYATQIDRAVAFFFKFQVNTRKNCPKCRQPQKLHSLDDAEDVNKFSIN